MSSPPYPNCTAILLAGGSGKRMADAVQDKILAQIAGKPLISHSLEAFAKVECIQTLVIVCRDAEQQSLIQTTAQGIELPIIWAQGGRERQDSVWAGLQATPDQTQIVLIHDCARPCITPNAISKAIFAADGSRASCLARPVSDTIKSVSPQGTGYTLQTVDRSRLWAMETPQVFEYSLIHDAYRKVIDSQRQITDDLSAIESMGIAVELIDNGRPNPKLTTPNDLAYLETILTAKH